MEKKHIVYRVFYDDQIVYVGRTNQPLTARIHGHLFAKPMHRKLSIDSISRIEYAEFKTEADMNLYEIYYILMLHPPLNVDDKTRDFPTVRLPDVPFHKARFPRWEVWKEEIKAQDNEQKRNSQRIREIDQSLHILRSSRRMNEISEEEYYREKEALEAERDKLFKKNSELW